METVTKFPVLDMNTIQPDAGIVKFDKDTINIRSVDIAEGIANAIKDGVIDPLEFAVKRKLIIDAFDLVMKDRDVKNICIGEVEKFGKQGAKKLGATITITGRATYDYSKDPTWVKLNNQAQPFIEAMKAQEEKIKTACKNNASLVDGETGELIASIVPHPKSESIAVSFSKK